MNIPEQKPQTANSTADVGDSFPDLSDLRLNGS